MTRYRDKETGKIWWLTEKGKNGGAFLRMRKNTRWSMPFSETDFRARFEPVENEE